MKIIAYKRGAQSDFHIHAGSCATCFYVPDLKCVIGTERIGTFGSDNVFVTRDPDILKEAEKLEMEGLQVSAPRPVEINVGRGVTISEMKVLDLNETLIKGTIDLLDVIATAREKVNEGMRLLLSEIK